MSTHLHSDPNHKGTADEGDDAADCELSAESLLRFSRLCHQSLETAKAASQIANTSRPLLGVQRVSVLVCRQKRFSLDAVSGIDSIAGKSYSKRRLRQAIAASTPLGEMIQYPPPEELPPVVQSAWENYVDAAYTSEVHAMPLVLGEKINGYIVAENFDAPVPRHLSDNLHKLAPICALVLGNAIKHEKTPLRWATWWLADVPRVLGWTATILALLTAVACLLYFVQVPADITAQGQAYPDVRRHVFVPSNAVVRKIHVIDGQVVATGDVLATLHSPDLTLRYQELGGQLDLRQQELSTVKTQRSGAANGSRRGSSASDREADQLASRESLLQMEITHLVQQRELVKKRLDELVLTSPIDGVIAISDPVASLTGRPLNRGRVLLDCYDPNSRWHAELGVAADDMTRLIAKSRESEESLTALVGPLATRDAVAKGHVRTIAAQTHRQKGSEELRLRVDVELSSVRSLMNLSAIDGSAIAQEQPRSGLSVVAKIDVGKESLGAWLFRDWYRWISDQLRFRFQIVGESAESTT